MIRSSVYTRLKNAVSVLSKKFICFILLLGITTFAFAETGILTGTITDKKSKEPLIGASVVIKSTNQGQMSDVNGKFTINNISTKGCTLIVRQIGYEDQTIENVKIKPNGTTVIDIQMVTKGVNLKGVTISKKANKESENVLLGKQKLSLIATQAVGAKEMSRKGIGDAEAAVAQVSGISKQEGVRNVFVRGLGDRYNYTSLDGLPLPSEDPEYKNISLDFFGTDVIADIAISKAFSTDNYKDVGGAAIDIQVKELMEESLLSIGGSVGFNSKTLGSDFLKPDGVNYWGFANNIHPGSDYKTNYNYKNSLDPSKVGLPLNYSYGLSAGKKIKIGENKNPLSFFLVGKYDTQYKFTNKLTADYGSTGSTGQKLEGNQSSQEIDQMILGNANYMFGQNKKQSISYNFLLIHDSDQSAGKYSGLIDKSELYDGGLIRQQANENLLLTHQLIGEFSLTKELDLYIAGAYNRVDGKEPDTRINYLRFDTEDEYYPYGNEAGTERKFFELIEKDYNTRIRLDYELSPKGDHKAASVAHLGYNLRYITDDFTAYEYCFTSSSTLKSNVQSLDNLSLDNWFNQDNLDAGYFTATDVRESYYQVHKRINSIYASVDYAFNPKLTANIGVNYDIIRLNIRYAIKNGTPEGNPLNEDYILPSVNLKYLLNKDQAFRLSLSKTYTLPQSKEIAPYLYEGETIGKVGNPDLTPSDNYNVDLKWDYYLSHSELITLTGFYKYINSPISCTYENSAAGYYTYDNVSDHATVAGIELEVRKNIFNHTDYETERVNKLTAGFNASYLYSSMYVDADHDSEGTFEKETQLQGAAPFTCNFDLSYIISDKDKSFTNTLVLNYFNKRLYSIGVGGFENTIEKGIPTLDFVSIANLNNHFGLKLKLKNIMDSQHKLIRKNSEGGNDVIERYNKGIDIDLGISYKF